MDVRIAIEPAGPTRATRAHRAKRKATDALRERLAAAIGEAGGEVVPLERANALAWLAVGDPRPLVDVLDAHPGITWVQLPWAGVENFAAAGLFDPARLAAVART